MNIFKIILVQPLFNLLILLMVWIPGHSLGWAILILTLLIRALLLPSSAHALRQQHKMKKIQPEMKALQDQHKNDKQAQAAAMMDLYKKYDIHPLGSCLPMLIQLPVLISLYYVFRQGITLDHLDLLYRFVPRPESINTHFLGLNLAAPNLALAILAGAAQFIQSRMLLHSPATHQPENSTQKILNAQLMYFTPFLTILISLRLPAALPFYWLITTLFSIGQQWWLFRHLTEPARLDAPTLLDSTQPPPALAVQSKIQTPSQGGVAVTVRKRGQ